MRCRLWRSREGPHLGRLHGVVNGGHGVSSTAAASPWMAFARLHRLSHRSAGGLSCPVSVWRAPSTAAHNMPNMVGLQFFTSLCFALFAIIQIGSDDKEEIRVISVHPKITKKIFFFISETTVVWHLSALSELKNQHRSVDSVVSPSNPSKPNQCIYPRTLTALHTKYSL